MPNVGIKGQEAISRMLLAPLGSEIDLTVDRVLMMFNPVNINRFPLEALIREWATPDVMRHCEIMRELNRENNGFTDARQFRGIGAFPPWIHLRNEYKKEKDLTKFGKWFFRQFPKLAYVNPTTI